MRPVKWQRTAIFKSLEAAGLDPRECRFDYDDAGFRITHVPSESYLLLEGDPGHYSATAVVGEGPAWPAESYSWTNVEERVGRWAEEVKRDVETPDLWAELQSEPELLVGAVSDEASDNTQFTPAEREELERRLREWTDYVARTYELSEEQIRLLEARVDYLAEAAGRVGKKDWAFLAVGVILGYVLPAALPPEAAKDILVTLFTSIGHMVGQSPLGLPGV
jgi:hypothetical protein